jgi:hypothetical protein
LLFLRLRHKFFYDFSLQNTFKGLNICAAFSQLGRQLSKVLIRVWLFGCSWMLQMADARARLLRHRLSETILKKGFLHLKGFFVLVHSHCWLWRKFKWMYKVQNTFL